MLPGFIFQSIVVGGGYGTGREVVEFFLSNGPLGGLLGMVVAASIWGAVLAVSFEVARTTKNFDYRHFLKYFLGRFWVIFEIAYVLLLLLVLAVLSAAAGEIIYQAVGFPHYIGILGMLTAVGVLSFYGTNLLEKVFASWSILLYAFYFIFLIWILNKFGSEIGENFSTDLRGTTWLVDGIRYAGYNIAPLAAILFSLRYLETRKEALFSGFLAGLIAIIPGVFFYIAMVGFYPVILDETVPATYMLGLLNAGWFSFAFQVVLFGTFIETGAGMIHALNERISENLKEKGGRLPQYFRPLIAVSFIALAFLMANVFGLIDIIAKGYGVLTFVFIAFLIVPVMTIGVYRVFWKKGKN